MSALIGVAAASEMLGISKRKVYDLAKEGKLQSYRIDSCVRFSPQDVAAYRQSCLSVTTRETSVGALSSTTLLRASGGGLADYFRKATRATRTRDQRIKSTVCTVCVYSALL